MSRASEFALALGLSLVLVPVMAIVAVLVWVGQGRPVIYRSTRAGKRGREFQLIKFRTMPSGMPVGVSGGHKISQVGAIGRILRKSRLDELPQIVNILRGDMSFVGPRPPMVRYARRSSCLWREPAPCRPGVTGLATLVFHRREESLLTGCTSPDQTERVYLTRCVARKDLIDRIYMDRRSTLSDLWIIGHTAMRVFGMGSGGRLWRRRPNKRPETCINELHLIRKATAPQMARPDPEPSNDNLQPSSRPSAAVLKGF